MPDAPEEFAMAPAPDRGAEFLPLLAVALGLSAVATQFLLLREFLAAFGGNELVIGLVLGNWMVATGIGALAGTRLKSVYLHVAAPVGFLLLLAVLPPVEVIALRVLRNLVFTSGGMVGIPGLLVASLVLLLPYCIVSGCAFTVLVKNADPHGRDSGARVYAWESLGSVAGGLLFNILLVAFLGTFQSLAILFLLDAGFACLLARRRKYRTLSAAALLTALAGICIMVLVDVDGLSRQFLFPGQEVVSSRDTPYGSLAVTRQGEQWNLFESGTLLTSTNDVIGREEAVHYALVQRPPPRKVLMIGGVVSGAPLEALRYGPERIDCAEINPWVIEAGRTICAVPEDPRIRILNEDARVYVKNAAEKYDAVLINLPDPSTAQLNRFFTLEFFRRTKEILTEGGIVSTGLLPEADYQGEEARVLGSSVLTTLRNVFRHVLVIPGERHYFVASDDSLTVGIVRSIEARNIHTAYVNGSYLDDALLAARSREITSSFVSQGEVNRDFQPVCYSLQLDYWLKSSGFSPAWLLAPVALLFIVVFLRSNPVEWGIFSMGATAAALQILLLIAFQAILGSLYQMTGMLVTAFMAGLAAGSGPLARIAAVRGMTGFLLLQCALAALSFLLSVSLRLPDSGPLLPAAAYAFFVTASVAAGALTGMLFAVALSVSAAASPSSAAKLYALDLVGSAAGALIVSIYVLPQLGVTGTAVAAGLLCLAGAGRGILPGPMVPFHRRLS